MFVGKARNLLSSGAPTHKHSCLTSLENLEEMNTLAYFTPSSAKKVLWLWDLIGSNFGILLYKLVSAVM